ncbi:MAG: pseudouridylate synthase, partial [Burkholderiales bacterium]
WTSSPPVCLCSRRTAPLRFVLHEGRKRQIRRMCELVGLRVSGLKRVRIGNAMLGDLPVGRWRYLSADETF